MSDRIMNTNKLEYGKPYRVVSNAGYFERICYFYGFNGEFAILKDEKGKTYHIHTQDFWRDDNPVYISYLLAKGNK